MTAVHVGDGYYSVTCTCDVCGADATKTWTAPKAQVKGIGDVWFQEHYHTP